MKIKRLSIGIKEAFYLDVKNKSDEMNITVSSLIKIALSEYLNKKSKNN